MVRLSEKIKLEAFAFETKTILKERTSNWNLYATTGKTKNNCRLTCAACVTMMLSFSFLHQMEEKRALGFSRDEIIRLHAEGKWRQVLNYFDDGHSDESLLWFRPTEKMFRTLNETLKSLNIKNIVSVGCGTGLLEWLLHCYTGIEVVGLEVDEPWWSSKYCPPKFWNRIQIVDPERLPAIGSGSVLLFCYFNNRRAFEDYMECFNGRHLILIGPTCHRHCDPAPLHLEHSDSWRILLEIPNDSGDMVVVYERTTNSQLTQSQA